MIQQRTINGSITEIYTNGGGETWITESKTTVFHNFWKTKALTPSESIEDFREVTASEKAQLEKVRDEWVRPPQLLIDQWNEMFGAFGKWNEETGYFNAYEELFDITCQQAIRIVNYGIPTFANNQFYNLEMPTHLIRTNAPFSPFGPDVVSSFWFYYQTDLEIAFLAPDKHDRFIGTSDSQARYLFSDCLNLKKILGRLKLINCSETNETFRRCNKLEEVKIILSNVKKLKLNYCIKLNYESYRFIVDNASNSVCTVSTTPGHYAALTGEAESYPFNGGTMEQY